MCSCMGFAVSCWAAGVACGGDPIFWVRQWRTVPRRISVQRALQGETRRSSVEQSDKTTLTVKASGGPQPASQRAQRVGVRIRCRFQWHLTQFLQVSSKDDQHLCEECRGEIVRDDFKSERLLQSAVDLLFGSHGYAILGSQSRV